jgi:hemimethylated DNA binding protein
MPPPSRALLSTLYRGLLKAASRLDALAPGARPEALLPPLLAAAVALPAGCLAGAPSLAAVVRAAFRAPAAAIAGEARVSAGLSLLRAANARAAALAAAPRAAEALAAGKPPGVHLSVGAVVRHAHHGYTGVVLGWNASCEAGAEWCARNGVDDPRQPFYTILVDVRDRPAAQVTYVAQGALRLLSGGGGGGGGGAPANAPADCLVLHPLVATHFEAFDARAGAFVPRPQLAAAYPCDAPGGWAPAGAARGVAAARAAAAGDAPPRTFVLEAGDDDPEPEAEPAAVPVAL